MTTKLQEMYESIKSMYEGFAAMTESLGAILSFIGAVLGWFGFSALMVLFGLLLFYKIFNMFFPVDRVLNFVFALAAVTAIWITWNLNYYKALNLIRIGQVYGFLGLHLVVVHVLHALLKKIVSFFKKKTFGKPIPIDDKISAYEMVDTSANEIKRGIREGDIRAAKSTVQELLAKLESIK